ncbi:unnamed protein product, partial [Onchocerca ochengi]
LIMEVCFFIPCQT